MNIFRRTKPEPEPEFLNEARYRIVTEQLFDGDWVVEVVCTVTGKKWFHLSWSHQSDRYVSEDFALAAGQKLVEEHRYSRKPVRNVHEV